MRLVFVLGLLSSVVWAADTSDSFVEAYIEFERAYLSNDARAVDRLLARDAEIKQTLHIPDFGPDPVTSTRSQLLRGMRQAGARSPSGLTSPADVTIKETESGFCGSGGGEKEVTVGGKKYNEREARKACFRSERGRYIVAQYSIDVYFDPLEPEQKAE